MIKVIYAVVDDIKEEGFEDNLIFSPGEYEIMFFQSDVYIEIDGKMKEYPVNTCILYEPGQRVHYRAKEGKLLYTWIRFDCDEPLFTEGYLPFGKPVFCRDLSYFKVYWQAVANENYWSHDSREIVLEELMHIIFHRLHDYVYFGEYSQYKDIFEKLRNEIWSRPEKGWTIQRMADFVNLSKRSMQTYYQRFFHCSCINEVIESRIYTAKLLLARTDENISTIADMCGYQNTEHFCRQFKKKVGTTPGKYKKEHLKKDK